MTVLCLSTRIRFSRLLFVKLLLVSTTLGVYYGYYVMFSTQMQHIHVPLVPPEVTTIRPHRSTKDGQYGLPHKNQRTQSALPRQPQSVRGWSATLTPRVAHQAVKLRRVNHYTGCIRPDLPLWPPSFRHYFSKQSPLECHDTEENWVYVENGTFRISRAATKRHGAIRCAYTPLSRGGDDSYARWRDTVANMKSGSPIQTDFFKVECTADDKATYENMHAGIVRIPEPTLAPTAGRDKSLGLNVLMIGFDSVSRLTWMRNLPKTYDYLVKVLGAVVLKGYNIVGDATTAALLPMFTGKHELELPESRKRFPGAKTVDGHPWIWKEYKKLGYVTMYAEDEPNEGAFTLRLSGFKNQPVDHYMRTYYLESNKLRDRSKHLCIGSLPRHVVHLNYARDFYRTYPARTRKFSFLFQSELSHGLTSTLQVADDDIVAFLKDMEGSGYLNDTVLIMMADHGPRFSYGRETVQGKHEERNPFMSFRFPPSFEKTHPDAMKNLRTNAQRLATPFDIHATLQDFINYSHVMMGDAKQRGISLLSEIPENRTCAQAAIAPHWCLCLTWLPMKIDEKNVKKAATALLATINSLTQSYRDKCEVLSLVEVKSGVRYTPNENVLKYKGGADYDKYEPDLTDKMSTNYALYQVTLRTNPGGGLYEGTITHHLDDDKFESRAQEISRINKYGNQPHCVLEELPHLRKYCYCKVQLK